MPLIPAGETASAIAELLQRRPTPPTSATEDEPFEALPLDASHLFDEPLADLLRARRSVRTFSDAAVTLGRLRQIIDTAHVCAASVWSRGAPPQPPLSFLVAANRVTGLAPGVYAPPDFDRSLLTAEALPELKQRYADAAALLYVCGPLSPDYAQVLTRAGSLGYAAWLSAISAGLAGSVFGAASARITAAARRVQPDLRHLFTVALGVE